MTNAVQDLAAHGVSVWLDDLSRELLESGDLQKLIDERNILGVTTNRPSSPTRWPRATATSLRWTRW